ncbi:glycerophosphoryl diester phosphodiesterase membrane domain-containing protein [Sphingomonas sp. DG1-23]|uniref:glycerophosphoryl diester phosphodiesterase membrane domain-containing protein n=1 Tax=Sphingomonas sp. DG1-23 TaxID=3068316 RepID=UPI00273D547F|nr:glycerophosphoryl diester phosphodiesterase membrane domain-containing protein [Sphingomonas sp. DG1-23]MDP5280903.1 glycerophosphoryl diester phosphodiesterase membrane domain-containing protein [Sphingomonas sp. DG1-23]
MQETEVSAGRLIAAMFALMHDNAVTVGVSILALSALGIANDLYNPEALTSLPISLACVAAQFVVTLKALERLGLVQRPAGAVGAYIGVSILTNIGIILGTLLLVIPGIVLAIRWSIAAPILLAEERGAAESLSESWARTKGHAFPILIAYLVPLGPLLGSFAAYALGDPESAQIPLMTSIIGNLSGNAFLAMTWFLSIAIYAAVTPAVEPFEEIFA